MNVAILVAIVGLFGVIIGGLINTGTTMLLDRRRERVHRQRERRDYARDLKRASRLIDAQLLGAHAAAVICVEKEHWWSEDVSLPNDAWQKYSGIIAPELSYTAWVTLMNAVSAVDHLTIAHAISVQPGLRGDIADTSKLIPMLQDIEAGRQALAPLVVDASSAPDPMQE
jgi:hypothetical protein